MTPLCQIYEIVLSLPNHLSGPPVREGHAGDGPLYNGTKIEREEIGRTRRYATATWLVAGELRRLQ